MATVAVFPRVAAIIATNGEILVPKLVAGQVRGMEWSGMVQGIDEHTLESTDLISVLSIWGRTGVVHATCSTKCLNRI